MRRYRKLLATVLYEAIEPGIFKFETGATKRSLPPIPIAPGAKAPTVEVDILSGDAVRKAHVMAGVFGVPEGMKMSKDDAVAAPPPLLSPDCNLSKYKDLFGNLQ
jgi:hypothetical protein